MSLQNAPLVQKVLQTYHHLQGKEIDKAYIISGGIIGVIEESVELPPEEKEAVTAAALLMVFNEDSQKLIEEGVGQAYCPRVEQILQAYDVAQDNDDGVRIAVVAQTIVLNEMLLANLADWTDSDKSFEQFFGTTIEETLDDIMKDDAQLVRQNMFPEHLPRLCKRYENLHCHIIAELNGIGKAAVPAPAAPPLSKQPCFRLH